MKVIWPRKLQAGDKFAIISPASIIKEEYVTGAVETLDEYGFGTYVMPHALGNSGSYSGTRQERLEDFTSAYMNTDVRSIMCSRGGYGAVHLLDTLDKLPLEDDPKWLIGFIDISALHALMAKHESVSIHASMAKGMSRGTGNALNNMLIEMLSGKRIGMDGDTSPFNRTGSGSGPLRGGNLAVLDGLVGTPFNDIVPGCILVIEDIAEPVYKIERMLYRLKLTGVLDRLSGLIVGAFTEYNPDSNHTSMEAMISEMLGDVSYPVAFGAPIGHIDDNTPWFHNAPATLTVTSTGWTLTYTD